MNKEHLVAEVGARLDVGRRAATEAVDAVVATVMRAVAAGEAVAIPGFGTFEPRVRAPRIARNPATGARVSVPVVRVPVFRPGTAFRQAVAGTTRPTRRRRARPTL